MNSPTSQTAGLYIHIPFCVRKCPYCDFNSYATEHKNSTFVEVAKQYVDSLITEFNHYCDDTQKAGHGEWQAVIFDTVFLGGGTPSLLPGEELARLLTTLKASGQISTEAEISIEANPGTIDEALGQEKLREVFAAGYNRISFGSQSFSPRKLQVLGRIHVPEDTYRAVDYARAAGFTNLNLDLMYGVKDETTAELNYDLEQLFSLNPSHISAYCLTIEPGTEFGNLRQRGVDMTSGEDFQGESYLETLATLEAHGYKQYEVSNYAKPGQACRHNLGYWSGKAYLGLGAGAASYLPSLAPWKAASADTVVAKRWVNLPGPAHYVSSIHNSGQARQTTDSVARERAIREFLFLRLRRAAGITATEFAADFGEPFPLPLEQAFKRLISDALIAQTGPQLRLTPRGFLFSNSVFEQLVEAIPGS